MDRYLETVQGTKGASQKVKLEEAVKHRESPSSVRLYSLLLVLFLYILYKRQGDTKFRGRWRLLAPDQEHTRCHPKVSREGSQNHPWYTIRGLHWTWAPIFFPKRSSVQWKHLCGCEFSYGTADPLKCPTPASAFETATRP